MNWLAEAAADRCQALDIARRDPQARTNLIDLSLFYNANLKQNWHGGTGGVEVNLAAVPTGFQTLAGTEFDIRGLIQLAGRGLLARGLHYPASVAGLPIHRRFARLHVLHATNFSVANATKIGAYMLHYADGRQSELPILYGQDVQDWCHHTERWDVSRATVAWTGPSSAVGSFNWGLRLCKRTWDNPRPDVEVESIDFTSTVTSCAPFLIALTLE